MRTIPILISFLLILSSSSVLFAEKRQTIRFYKLNSKDQAVRVLVRDKTAKKSGCHNFISKKKIFRLTQIGFEYCSVYMESNCAEGSAIKGAWDNEKFSTQLTQGGEWLFVNEANPRGTKMKSWHCQ